MNIFSDKVLSSKNLCVVFGLGIAILAIGRLSGRSIFKKASEETDKTTVITDRIFPQINVTSSRPELDNIQNRTFSAEGFSQDPTDHLQATTTAIAITSPPTSPETSVPRMNVDGESNAIQRSLASSSIAPSLQLVFNGSSYEKPFDFVNKLILPLLKEVGNYLTIKDIAACLLVSREWKVLTNSLGDGFAEKLGCAPAQLSTTVSQLKQIAFQYKGCLNQRIMTAEELDLEAMSFSFMAHRISESERAKRRETYCTNINAKLQISSKLEKLFNAQFELAKIGLADWKEVEGIAEVLKKKCGSCQEYQQIALMKAEAGEIESALTIAQQKLGKYETSLVYYKIVQYYVDKKYLQNAYETYFNYFKDKEDIYVRESYAFIWHQASESNNFDILEKLIDLDKESEKTSNAQNYIKLLIENGNMVAATKKVKEKYKKNLDYLEVDYLFSSSVQIYVKLGLFDHATQLTIAAFNKVSADTPEHSDYRIAWYHLRNAYSQNGLEGEAQKIQMQIDAMEKVKNEK